MKFVITILLLLYTSTAFSFDHFDQGQFDKHIKNNRIVLIKFIEEDIPTLNRAIVRMLIRQNSVVKMQGKGLEVHGEPFLGIFTKDTRVLFYGKHKR